jgi:uncharacterized protein DUF6946
MDDAIRYQLLHRTASAILTAQEFHANAAVVLIHSFGRRKSVRDDFESFCHALSAQDLPGGMKSVSSFAKPRLFLGWCDGDHRFLDVQLRDAA